MENFYSPLDTRYDQANMFSNWIGDTSPDITVGEIEERYKHAISIFSPERQEELHLILMLKAAIGRRYFDNQELQEFETLYQSDPLSPEPGPYIDAGIKYQLTKPTHSTEHFGYLSDTISHLFNSKLVFGNNDVAFSMIEKVCNNRS